MKGPRPTKAQVAYAFCIVQVLLAAVFCWPIGTKMWNGDATASNAWFGAFALFCITLGLPVLRDWRADRDADRGSLAIVLGWWLILSLTLLVIEPIRFGTVSWSERDTEVSATIVILLVAVLGWTRLAGRSLRDPVVAGLVGLVTKALPQLYVAWEIGMEVKLWDSMPQRTLAIGFATVALRLIQTRRAQKAPSNVAIALGEGGNLVSWLIVLVIWLWNMATC